MRQQRSNLLVLLLFVGLLPSVASANADKPSVVQLDVQIVQNVTPVMAEGIAHLLYEMRLTSFARREIRLKSIEVIDDQSKAVVVQYEGDRLAGMVSSPGRAAGDKPPLAIEPGGFAIVYFDGPPAASGHSFSHRIRIEPGSDTATEDQQLIETGNMHIADTPARVVGPPLQGAGWIAANALSNTADHRRTTVVVDGKARTAQRYAIDFLKLDKKGHAYVGDPSLNSNWAGYGSPVLAVADGVVQDIQDRFPDNTPLKPPAVKITLESIGGNHVMLALPGGGYVFYGHLKPGSIRVRKGQRVKRGDIIGALGNSGQTDAPHLHIHVADAPSSLGADGLAFAFDSFSLEGHVPSLDVLDDPKGWERPDGVQPTRQLNELPLENAVIAFP